MKNLKVKYNLLVFLICSAFAIFAALAFAVSFISAEDINLKISAQINSLSTDFYAITDSNANETYDGYDLGSQPLQTNDSRLFSWCNISDANSKSWPNCTFVIDSWPASNRTFYLVYRVSPSSSGVLNLTWDSSVFSSNFSSVLVDYGTNSTYSSGANLSSPVDMKINENYLVSGFSGAWRYLLMNLTYFSCTPNCTGKVCGDDGCGGSCGTCTTGTCSNGVCTTNPPGCTPNCGDRSQHCVGTTYSNGCSGGEDACSGTKQPDCSCASNTCSGSTCSNGCGGTCDGTKPVSSCPSAFEVQCGNAITPTNGCGTCTGTGTKCGIGEQCSNNACVQASCTVNTQCNDDNACTDDRCVNFRCNYLTYNSDSCDDENDCTSTDKCNGNGRCVGSGTCSGELVCENKKCVAGIVPEEIPVEILALAGQGAAGAGCAVDLNQVQCGDWSKCEGKYDVSRLIDSLQIKGVQTRSCSDNSNCLPDYTESSECALKEEVTVKTTVWCGEEYTELADLDGATVARIKKTTGGESLVVDLNAAGKGYCAYCYNGVTDGDEEGIDCGGSCDNCGVSVEAYNAPLFNFAKLVTALGFFLFFLVFFILLSADLILYLKNVFLLKRLGGKFSYWKKEGYDVNILEKDLSRMEKAFEYKVHKSKKK